MQMSKMTGLAGMSPSMTITAAAAAAVAAAMPMSLPDTIFQQQEDEYAPLLNIGYTPEQVNEFRKNKIPSSLFSNETFADVICVYDTYGMGEEDDAIDGVYKRTLDPRFRANDPKTFLFIGSDRDSHEATMKTEKDLMKGVVKIDEGLFTCIQCKGKKVIKESKQMRSADEATGAIFHCVECSTTWTIT